MRNFARLAFAVAFALAAPSLAAQTEAPEPKPETHAPPAWYLNEIDIRTRDGGRWVADNSAYKSETEPFDAYVVEWTRGYAHTLTGRLYGLTGDEASIDFWTFHQYWHPGRGEAVLEQFGAGGAIGVGVIAPDAEGPQSDQTFYGPDGSVSRTGHIEIYPDALEGGDDNVILSESWTIDASGAWTEKQRDYRWVRDVRKTEE